jgi:hypothetical protein
MLDADTLPGQPIRPAGDVARCKDAWRSGLQELVDHNAAIDGKPRLLRKCHRGSDTNTNHNQLGIELLAGR